MREDQNSLAMIGWYWFPNSYSPAHQVVFSSTSYSSHTRGPLGRLPPLLAQCIGTGENSKTGDILSVAKPCGEMWNLSLEAPEKTVPGCDDVIMVNTPHVDVQYVCMYVCMYIYIYIYIRKYMCMYISIYIYIYTHVLYIYNHINIYIYVYI